MEEKIFLLSKDEYEKYKEQIPYISDIWWLRSPGDNSINATCVYYDGFVDDFGYGVNHGNSVRPALYYENLESEIIKSKIRDDRFIFNDFPFRIINKKQKLAIAESVIAYDIFDNMSNNYDSSNIKKKLHIWFETGIWE